VSTDLLVTALSASVPLYIEELRGLSVEDRLNIAHDAAQIVAEKGDVILYRSNKKGETAKAFNALARGLAALAFQPSGVTFLGMKFEVTP
jgi:hypothetical protein